MTDDGHYLVIQVRRGTGEQHQIFYLDLSKPDAKVVELITDFDAAYDFVGNEGRRVLASAPTRTPRATA